MARQLRAQGQDVALLALLDTKRPKCPKAPVLVQLYCQARSFQRQGLVRYLRKEVWRRVRRGARRITCKSSLRFGYPPPHALGSDLLLRERARQAANSYETQPYPGRITLFRAAESKFYQMHPGEPCLGWDSVAAGGVEVHKVPGKHGKLVKEPHVEALAARLKTCLEQARAGSPP